METMIRKLFDRICGEMPDYPEPPTHPVSTIGMLLPMAKEEGPRYSSGCSGQTVDSKSGS